MRERLLADPWGALTLGLALLALSVALSSALVAAFVLSLPADYFVREPTPLAARGWRWYARAAARNALGLLLVLVGIALSMPGVPGQGVLTIVVGVLLLEVPGKRRLERRLARSPRILRALNGLRGRFAREPFAADAREGAEEARGLRGDRETP